MSIQAEQPQTELETRVRSRSGRSALAAARALLAEESPDLAAAVPLLVEALAGRDVQARATAAEILVCLGPAAALGLVAAWEAAELDLRKSIIVTLGKLGTDAATARQLLKGACADEALRPWAEAALRCARAWHPAHLLDWLRSPQPWRRLPDLLHSVLTHPGLAVLSLLSTVLSVWHWWRQIGEPGDVAIQVSGAFAFLGASVGATVGAQGWGLTGAKLGAKNCGICGAAMGFLAGGAAGTLVQPLVQVLGRG